MPRVLTSVTAALAVAVALGAAGCSEPPPAAKDKMGKDKMSGDKMDAKDKMGGDKMGDGKMGKMDGKMDEKDKMEKK